MVDSIETETRYPMSLFKALPDGKSYSQAFGSPHSREATATATAFWARFYGGQVCVRAIQLASWPVFFGGFFFVTND